MKPINQFNNKIADKILNEQIKINLGKDKKWSGLIRHTAIKAMEMYSYQPKEVKEEWISIRKRKPKHLENVLLYNINANWVVAGNIQILNKHSYKYYNQFNSFESGDVEIYPTHWMPLPKGLMAVTPNELQK